MNRMVPLVQTAAVVLRRFDHVRPPHRVLADVRLAHAYARLRDGAAVTETCFAVGFGSFSHFVTTFRRRYGSRPSEIPHRRRAGR